MGQVNTRYRRFERAAILSQSAWILVVKLLQRSSEGRPEGSGVGFEPGCGTACDSGALVFPRAPDLGKLLRPASAQKQPGELDVARMEGRQLCKATQTL